VKATPGAVRRSLPEPNFISLVMFRAPTAIKDKAMARKYSKGAQKKVEEVMHERKAGTLKSGSGKTVKSRKQAIAIGLSEARKAGKKVPKKAKKKTRKKS
jgi:hypothetical protein